jgi:protein-tyrosine phosphatase
VSSAGTGALVGFPMPDQAQVIARDLGVVSPELHVARAITIEQLREASLVLALSREHRRAIVEMLPRGARHTFTLRELERLLTGVSDSDFDAMRDMDPDDVDGRLNELVEVAASRRGRVLPPDSPEDDDVIDPYRRDDDVYRVSAEQIVSAVDRLLEQVELTTRMGRG